MLGNREMMIKVVRFIFVTLLFNSFAWAHDESITKISERTVLHGNYLEYVPNGNIVGLLVVVHGTPEPKDDVKALAEKFLKRWTSFAEQNSVVVVAPVFGNDYGSLDQTTPGVSPGGYRGLFGRLVGADDFLHEIVEASGHQITNFNGQFYLYGHSAGGQFTSRYCVRHPQRILAAVISAGGRYPFPDANVTWPYGMAKSEYLKEVPKPEGWLKAAELPINVLVGLDDNDPQPKRSGQEGLTRIEIARNWVQKMNQLAQQNGKIGRVKLTTVNGVGHDSKGLTFAAQKALAESMALKKKKDPKNPNIKLL